MITTGIDQEALATLFSEATARQGELLRRAVGEATLKALQGRELTLENIRKVLKAVTQAASAGAAENPASATAVARLLSEALVGMDTALLKAVDAQRMALQQFVDQGVDFNDKQMKSALANLEKMEDIFFATVTKVVQGDAASLKAPWEQVLSAMKLKGSDSGAQASATVEQLLAQAKTALRDGRASGLGATKTMLKSYAALVSGVLIGMTENLQPKAAAPATVQSRKK